METSAGPVPDDAAHLLVVDDDRRIRDALSRYLQREGYRVTTAKDAVDARAKLIPDAYLAALALEHGCEVVTTDKDFRRFPGLRWRPPLNQAGP